MQRVYQFSQFVATECQMNTIARVMIDPICSEEYLSQVAILPNSSNETDNQMRFQED